MISKKDELQQFVSKIEIEGRSQTDNGNWLVYFDEFKNAEYEFLIENKEEILNILRSRESVSEVLCFEYKDYGYFDIMFYLNYCPNVPEAEFREF